VRIGQNNQIKTITWRNALLAIVCFLTFFSTLPAFAAPEGGLVVGGSATITQMGPNTTIQQTTERGIIRWDRFDVGASERVEFQQPSSSSITINRIRDSKPSQIDGQISANGRVVMINPNGVVFGETAQIDVGGLIASTSDLENDTDFLAGGPVILNRTGQADAKIINKGQITIREAGLGGLVAGHVENQGVISARLGKVALASGDITTIDFAGDGLIQLEVSDAVLKQQVLNKGIVKADGGQILISAAAARDVVDSLINNEGQISTATYQGQKGNLKIRATKATFQNTGTITANGDITQDAGSISIDVGMASLGGQIQASGKSGGHIDIVAKTISLADPIKADGLNGSGGSIHIFSTGNIWETSTSRITANGTLDGGKVFIEAGLNLTSSGRYSAIGTTGKGGQIDITAGGVKLLSAQHDASGATEGGRIRVGGEFQGGKNLTQDELKNAQITTFDRGSKLIANGTGDHAKGGEVILWSDKDTLSLGTIEATPGLNAGAGGFVEVSSGDTLTTDTTIQTGRGDRRGTVLLDPKNIQIANSTFNPTAIIMGRGFVAPNVNTPFNYGGEFGSLPSVSLDGNRMAVGWLNDIGADGLGNRAGAVYLYSFTDAAFSGGVLEGIMGRGYTGGKNVNVPLDNTWDRFGSGVSLDGNRIAIGAFAGDGRTNGCGDCGEVYLYTFSDAAFNGATLQGRIGHNYTLGAKDINIASQLNGSDLFGWSVSLDGNRLAVGAREGDGFNNLVNAAGDVYLFSFTDSLFSGGVLEAQIGSGFTGGKNINQTLDPVDRFGWSVSLNGNRLAIGARDDDGFTNANDAAGAVYLYSFTNSTFSGGVLESIIGQGYVGGKNLDTSAFANAGDYLGMGVSLDGNRLAVGIPFDDGNGNSVGNSGAVYLYDFTDSVFSGGQIQARIGNNYNALGGKNLSRPNEAEGSDQFGYAVSLDGNRLVASAVGDDGPGNVNTDQGAYHFYTFSNAAFTGGVYQGSLGRNYTGGKNINFHLNTAPDSPGDRMSVSLSNNRIAIGMPYGDGFNDGLGDSGEVYLYSFASSNFDSAVLEAIIGSGYTGGKNVNLSAQLGASDYFGESVSLDGNRLAVGARGDDGRINSVADAGAVYLFSFTDASFNGGVLQSRIGQNYGTLGGKNFSVTNLAASDWFGSGVSLDGNRLAVTASRDDGNPASPIGDSGAVYLFTFADSVFTTPTLQSIIGGNYGALGGKNFSITNLGISDVIGEYGGVALDGNRLVFTARGDDGFGNTRNDSGAAYLMTFSDALFSSPTLQGIMGYGYTGSNGGTNGKNVNMTMLDVGDFLAGVALEGATLALGASRDDGALNNVVDAGAIHIYNFDDLLFTNGQLDATIGFGYTGGKNINTSGIIDGFDFLGVSLDLNNGTLVASLPGLDGSDAAGSQNANVYNASGGVFIYRGNSNPVTNGNAFATLPSNTIGITPANITALLNTPQNVILHASNDIIVDDAVIANNPSGNAGNLTLQAGRSILVNANITTDNGNLNLYANEDLAAGVVNAQRDPGAAEITMAAGTTINAGSGSVHIRLEDGTGKTNFASGFINLRTITAGTILVHSVSNISSVVLNGALTASGTGTPLTIAAGKDFINNFGAGALNAPSGRWLVYSDSPILNTLGGITAAFDRYLCLYGGSCPSFPGTGNGLLYEYGANLLSISVNTSRLYGDANPNNATLQSLFVYNGFQGADNVSVLDVLPTATVAGSATATALGGSQHAITLSGGSDNFYTYYFLDPSFLTINARPLTATWSGPLTKVYGDGNPSPSFTALTYTGFVNGETIGGYSPTFSVNFNGVTTATGVGSYNVTPSWTLGGNLLLNYTISAPDGVLDITKRDITAAWTGGLSKTYGDANPTVTTANFNYTGFVNGDTGAVVTPTANFGVIDGTTNAGTYAVAVSATFSAANYNVTNTPTTGITINKRNVTATVASKSRVYGASNPTWNSADVTFTNLVNGDTASGMDTLVFTSPILAATANVGTTQNITITSFLDNNYNLTSTTPGVLSITKRDITATIGSKSRQYGDANPSWTWSDVTWGNLANLETGSVLDSVMFTSPTLNATSNAGSSEAITITSFLDNNYNLTTTTGGTLTINKRDTTATVTGKSRIYGDANPSWVPASDVTFTNLVNGDGAAGMDSVVFTSPSLAATANVGTTESITITSFLDNNYHLTGTTPGVLSLTKRNITGVVNNDSRAYGDTNPIWNWSNVVWSNLANLETGVVLDTMTISAPTAVATSNAGTTHSITISGFLDNNYNLTGFTAGTLTINKRNMTASWTGPLSRDYGDANPTVNTNNFIYSDLVNGDTNSAVTANADFGGVGATTNVGAYGVGVLFTSLNYQITNAPATILTINKRNITATISNKSRAYGDANPTWSWADLTLTNMANGETGSIFDNLVFTTPTLTATDNAGSTQSIAITSFLDNNYNLTSHTTGTLNIIKRDITASVASKTRAYGDANPTWSLADLTLTNMANGETGSVFDNLVFTSPTLSATDNAGSTQAITIMSFLDNNYNLTVTTQGLLSIGKRDITAIINNDSRVYGDANPIWNWTHVVWGNLANAETGLVLDSFLIAAPTATANSNAGTSHTIGLTGFNDNNYNLTTTTDGILSINKRNISATISNKSRFYGDANPIWAWSDIIWSNMANLETGSVIDSFAVSAPTATALSPAASNHSVSFTSFSDNNYNLQSSTNGQLSIAQAPLTLVVNNAQRPAQAANPVFTFSLSGLRNGQTNSVLSGVTFSTLANFTSTPGTYTVSATGGSALNYVVVLYIDGVLTVGNANSLPSTVEWSLNNRGLVSVGDTNLTSSAPIVSPLDTSSTSNSSSSNTDNSTVTIPDQEIEKYLNNNALIIILESAFQQFRF
jgi:filamentous hemagglutinin family protein